MKIGADRIERVMVELFGAVRRGVEVKRQLLQLLRHDRLVVARGLRNPGGQLSAELEAVAAANIDHHSLGVGALGRVCRERHGIGRGFGQLEQGRGFAQCARDGDDRAFRSTGLEQGFDARRDLVAGRLDPDRARSPEQAHRPGFVGENGGVGLYRRPKRAQTCSP